MQPRILPRIRPLPWWNQNNMAAISRKRTVNTGHRHFTASTALATTEIQAMQLHLLTRDSSSKCPPSGMSGLDLAATRPHVLVLAARKTQKMSI